ncbi:hypothetical protein G4O51_03645 [Candidatus Bathyarchaeota archaeon A05DMB-2]|jgi:hypothetical protein|nr:hypothetical protein [Candidatus Bathyarchaeota archaeon A05DMB-2]
MSGVSRRIIETIEESEFPKEIKDMLKALLNVELRNSHIKSPLYGKDYDRIIMETAETRRRQESK